MFQYQMVEEKIVFDEIAAITYGVTCLDDQKKIVKRVSDVSLDREWMTNFVDLINEEQLYPVHLLDVILDILP